MTKKKERKREQREDGTWWTVPKRGRAVQLTRCSNTLTEQEFWSRIRSVIRGGTRFWKPAIDAVEEFTRPYKGENKRIKKETQCQSCFKWVAKSSIQKDHIIPCGSLSCGDDVKGFIERAFCEKEGFQPLCKECHNIKTQKERKNKE